MQDQPERSDPAAEQITISDYSMIRQWCNSLECSEVQLAEAIAQVGYSAALVRVYLAKQAEGPRGETAP